MMQKINYQKELDKKLEEIQREGATPSLLLHACCAPCSSYCLEYLSEYFNITVFYYNPNISPAEEYEKRVSELHRLVREMNVKHPVRIIDGIYDPETFYQMAKGMEEIPEGGERCFACYRLRLEKTAQVARENHFDFFTTTLSISPLKNAQKLNEIGAELSEIYSTDYLFSDFKKKNGYKRSIELSQEHHLYRQDFCGCVYSKRQREFEIKRKSEGLK